MEGRWRWKVEGGGVEWGGREVEWKEERLSFLWSLRPHAPLHTDHIGGHIIHWSRYFCIKYRSDTLYFPFTKLNKYRYRENMHLSNGQ